MTARDRHDAEARALRRAIERAGRERATLRLFLALAEVFERGGHETIDDLIELLERADDDRDD